MNPHLKEAILTRFPRIHQRYAHATARRQLKIDVFDQVIDIVDLKQSRRLRIARRHHGLIEDLMNNFEHYFGSVMPMPILIKNHLYQVVDFSTPRYHDVIGFSDFPILFPTITEPLSTTQQYLDLAQLKPGEVVLDLGAYCGLTTICFSKAVGPSGHVIALEPDPISFFAAQNNLQRFQKHIGWSNLFLYNAAATANTGKTTLCAEATMGSGDPSVLGDWRGNVIEVDGLSLDAILGKSGLQKIDFVKIDIEGSERDLLAGSSDFFLKNQPRLIIEPHLIGETIVTSEVISIIAKYGYNCQIIEQVGSVLPLILATSR